MQSIVWHLRLASALEAAIAAPLRALGVDLLTEPPLHRAPDGILATWDARADVLERLAASDWADGSPPAQIYLADVARHREVCEALRDTHADVVLLPCRCEDVVVAVDRAVQRRERGLRPPSVRDPGGLVEDGLVGVSEVLRRTIETACQVAASPGTGVLIEGESGTGKELFARLIHARAPGGRHRPFVDVNCAAIPTDLLEAELFGYERGAFTEAARDKAGLMELAHGGTLFLDEIGELNIALQAKLLRAIETQTFRRLGGVTHRRAVCRVVASTNRHLLEAVQRGLFRLDLYHRLAVMTIHIAPLRDRRDDILPLAHHFLRTLGCTVNRRVTGFSPAAVALLLAYPYPGNVRELRNIVERALILETGPLITPKALGGEVSILADTPPAASLALPSPRVAPSSTLRSLEEEERRHIEAALTQTGGNRTQAARLLGISVPTLYSKIRKFGFEHVGR